MNVNDERMVSEIVAKLEKAWSAADGAGFAQPFAKDATYAFLLSVGPTGSKTSNVGEMKQLSERWFYFLDIVPGWRARKP